MFINAELLQIIESLELPKKTTRFYYDATKNIYFTCSLKELKSKLGLKMGELLRILMRRKKTDIVWQKNVIVRKSLNGLLYIDPGKGEMTKILDKKLEPDFLNHELQASKILGDNFPQILKSGEIKKYHFITYKLYKNVKRFSWENWEQFIIDYREIIVKLSNLKNLTAIDSVEYKNHLLSLLDNLASDKKYLIENHQQVVDLIKSCLKQYTFPGTVYRGFAHGDLVPNNVFLFKKHLYVCDWANGGLFNVFYDLMMQNVYKPESVVWKNFDSIDLHSSNDKAIFSGWAKEYTSIVEKNLGMQLSNNVIKNSLVLSLAERYTKEFLHHQSETEYKNGEITQFHTKRICENILMSGK